jgi:hypothetical protein
MSIALVLERDVLSRVYLSRVIGMAPGASVFAAANEREAKLFLGVARPDLIVMDVTFGRSRLFEMINTEVGTPAVILISSDEGTGPPLRIPAALVLPRPIASGVLFDAVRRFLPETTVGIAPTLTDHVQLACAAERSLQLRLVSRTDVGVITIEQGCLWSAKYGRWSGIQAVAAALGDEDVLVHLDRCEHPLPPRQLAGHWRLLLNQARQLLRTGHCLDGYSSRESVAETS